MTILSAQSIRDVRPIEPLLESFKVAGMTAGLSVAGYDVRIREAMTLERGGFALASTMEPGSYFPRHYQYIGYPLSQGWSEQLG